MVHIPVFCRMTYVGAMYHQRQRLCFVDRFWHRQVTLHVFYLLEMIRHVRCEHDIDNEASELPVFFRFEARYDVETLFLHHSERRTDVVIFKNRFIVVQQRNIRARVDVKSIRGTRMFKVMN